MTTSSSQQLNIPARQAVSVGDFIDSILASVPAHRKIEQCKFSALQEEMQDVIVDDTHNVQDGYHRIPGPRTSAENGESDPVTEQLLQDDQLDIEGDSIGVIQSKLSDVFCDCLVNPTTAHTGESLLQYQSFGQSIKQTQSMNAAARTLLGLAILNNAITVRHYWWIVKNLRQKLLEVGLIQEIPCREAYARVLSRLVERFMTDPNQQDSIPPYSRPRDYVACLGMLLDDMADGFVIKQQSGIEDDVCINNKELHTDHLSSLASRLRAA